MGLLSVVGISLTIAENAFETESGLRLKNCKPILQEDKIMTKIVLSLMLVFFMPTISFAGDIWVYDANNQKLGIAMSAGGQEVFLPSLNRSTVIVWSHDKINYVGKIKEYNYTLHQDSSCTEPPGTGTTVPPGYIHSYKIYHRSPFYAYYDFDPTKKMRYTIYS